VQILKQEQDQPAVLAVTGSDSYVSPDWYGVDDQVPTWNYVAVHLRGRLSLMPSASLHKVLCGISATMEARLLPKKPWTTDKMTPEIYERMQRQIVPVSLDVDIVEGTWKLSQNKPAEVRLAAAEMVADHGQGSEIRTMSGLMYAAENNQDN
jgi:transcriptional regulator